MNLRQIVEAAYDAGYLDHKRWGNSALFEPSARRRMSVDRVMAEVSKDGTYTAPYAIRRDEHGYAAAIVDTKTGWDVLHLDTHSARNNSEGGATRILAALNGIAPSSPPSEEDARSAIARSRRAAQTIIEAIGADGPMNVEEAATRIVARLNAALAESRMVREASVALLAILRKIEDAPNRYIAAAMKDLDAALSAPPAPTDDKCWKCSGGVERTNTTLPGCDNDIFHDGQPPAMPPAPTARDGVCVSTECPDCQRRGKAWVLCAKHSRRDEPLPADGTAFVCGPDEINEDGGVEQERRSSGDENATFRAYWRSGHGEDPGAPDHPDGVYGRSDVDAAWCAWRDRSFAVTMARDQARHALDQMTRERARADSNAALAIKAESGHTPPPAPATGEDEVEDVARIIHDAHADELVRHGFGPCSRWPLVADDHARRWRAAARAVLSRTTRGTPPESRGGGA